METGPYANPAQAVLALRRALAADPGNLTFLLGLMELYREQGRLSEARNLGEARLAQGDAPEVRQLLALVLAEQGATEDLLALHRGREGEAALAVEAGTHATWAGQWDTGLALLEHGLAGLPDHWEGWLTLCKALFHDLRVAEALERVDWLLAQPLGDGDLRAQVGFMKGVGHMLLGDFATGLAWLESRFGMEHGPRLGPLPLVPWQGEPVAGRTLLLRSEQGFGDVFMMARYIPLLAAQGARVLLAPQPRTQAVLATCEGLAGLVEGTVNLPADALQAPLLSLPRLCGTTLATVPAQVPYLKVPDAVPSRAAIEACLAQAGGRPAIGLVWAGNPGHQQDRERSMPPELFDLFADVPGIAWVDLQVQEGPRPNLPLLDLASRLTDFADTAYALSRLDGIISIDSSPVHLAGALARPVWMAVARLPDWRWMLDRRDSPWYPTVEIWRQPTSLDWTGLVQRMRGRLLSEGFQVHP